MKYGIKEDIKYIIPESPEEKKWLNDHGWTTFINIDGKEVFPFWGDGVEDVLKKWEEEKRENAMIPKQSVVSFANEDSLGHNLWRIAQIFPSIPEGEEMNKKESPPILPFSLGVSYDAEEEFRRAKARLESFRDEFEKDYPACSLSVVMENAANILTLRSEIPDVPKVLGLLEILKNDIIQKWKDQ